MGNGNYSKVPSDSSSNLSSNSFSGSSSNSSPEIVGTVLFKDGSQDTVIYEKDIYKLKKYDDLCPSYHFIEKGKENLFIWEKCTQYPKPKDTKITCISTSRLSDDKKLYSICEKLYNERVGFVEYASVYTTKSKMSFEDALKGLYIKNVKDGKEDPSHFYSYFYYITDDFDIVKTYIEEKDKQREKKEKEKINSIHRSFLSEINKEDTGSTETSNVILPSVPPLPPNSKELNIEEEIVKGENRM